MWLKRWVPCEGFVGKEGRREKMLLVDVAWKRNIGGVKKKEKERKRKKKNEGGEREVKEKKKRKE